MIEDIKDRVPSNVLSNNAIRYGIYDENGALLRYEYIKREDEPIEIGTPINRALFSNIQGDLYTQDRYNIPVVTLEPVGKGLLQGDIIPKEWEKVSDLEYKAHGVVLTASSVKGTSYPYLACDVSGSGNTFYKSQGSSSNRYEYLQWEFEEPQKISKMYVLIDSDLNYMATDYESIVIQGSNGSEWIDLHNIALSSSKNRYYGEITLTNTDYYKYYRIYAYCNGSSFAVGDWYVTEYEGDTYAYVNNLSLPLTSYEVGKIVRIKGNSYTDEEGTEITSFENPYININNLGVKQINGTIVANEKYSLIYNGESWDISPKDYVTGNYTGTTAVNSNGSQKITLGFRPKIVIVYCAEYGFVDLGADAWYGAIALDGYPALDGGVSGNPAYLTITETGFEAKSTRNHAQLNYSGFNYRYIAFK